MEDNKLFFTPGEFAKELEISRRTVYTMLKDNKIYAVKLNIQQKSHWRIPRTELQRIHALAYDEEGK